MLPLLSLIFKKFKSLIVLFFIISNVQIHAQIVYIPDSGFKNRLLHHTVFGGEIIDTNGDHEIQVSEAEAITDLDVGAFWHPTNRIYDLTGIEAFVNITRLDCSHNNLTNLNLENNLALTHVQCDKNRLTNVNVKFNIMLENLYCPHNELASINVSNNPKLVWLYCYSNLISTLDISRNVLLEHLYCSHNQLATLDVTQNKQLKRLRCNSNDLTSLDVTQNYLLENVFCSYNQLLSIDFTQNPLIDWLWCNGNQLLELDIRNGNNVALPSFNAVNNPNLSCILVDNTKWSTINWLEIDTSTTFVETQAACESLSINEVISSQDILAYPNPTYDILNIDISNSKDNTFIIYDTFGRVSKQGILNKKQIDIEALDVGVYLLSINGVIIRLLKL